MRPADRGKDGFMAYVLTRPQVLATAATDVAAIGTTINEATTAAAGRTTGVVAAAADEVSASIATVFDAYAREWQAVIGRAAVFHGEFARTLAAGGNAYANAEAAGAAALAAPRGRGGGGPARHFRHRRQRNADTPARLRGQRRQQVRRAQFPRWPCPGPGHAGGGISG
jgi:hypothetical protein